MSNMWRFAYRSIMTTILRDRLSQRRDVAGPSILPPLRSPQPQSASSENVKQGEVDGTEGKEISITFPSGQTRQFTGQSLLLGNSLPNFWFHTTTAYDIVRQCGVEVAKRDFMGAP
jgi:hypothetical protein